MIKYYLKLATFFVLLLSSVAHAGLITSDLTEDNYITVGNLDWAWASPVNVPLVLDNTLYAPTFHTDWRYAVGNELLILQSLTLEDFEVRDVNGNLLYIKQAVEYWNDISTHIDVSDFNEKMRASAWTNDPQNEYNYETFYVRDVAQVPEPSTLLIFAIALIALSMKKRAIK